VTQRVALAVNPTSGRGRGGAAGETTARRLAAAGVDVVRIQAGSGAELARLTRDEVSQGVEALVVVGGDGMTHLGVNVVAGTATPLGIVAAGTGNDIARDLGLPVADAAAATQVIVEALAGQHRRAIDAVRCTGGAEPDCWFAGVLGAGFDALVNERANAWRWPRGRLRYDAAILRELPLFRPREYELVLDGKARRLRAMLVAVANGPSYGGGMRVCPDARFDDGLLDVLLVSPVSTLSFLRLYPRVYSGAHVTHEAVEIVRARRVEIFSAGIVAYADGERVRALPLVCEVVPGAVSVLY
jgi:diacylglycerol kinase (ATP)